MLDPAVSAGIKKYGLLKWGFREYPYMILSGSLGVIGGVLGIYFAFKEVEKNKKAPFTTRFLVVRPDDPRLKFFKVWGPDEVQE